MPRGVKTDSKKTAEIITDYALTNSYNATAKKVGVAANTVKNVIDRQKEENPEEFERICEEKKDEFIQKASKIIDKAMDKLDKELNKDGIAVNNLTTVIGTLYDKRALAEGKSTVNESFDVNIRVIE